MNNIYRARVTGCFVPDINHVTGYAEHRGQSREPAEYVRPPRILVIQILHRCPLYQIEEEYSL